MKRKILVFMTIAALAAALMACGGKASGQETKEESKAASAVKEESTAAESTSQTSTAEESEAPEAEGVVTGGWTINDDDTAAPLPENVQAAFDKAIESLMGVNYTPVAYLGSQVVAGTNHMILCKTTAVTANPVAELKVVIVYEPVSGDPEVLSVMDFNLAELSDKEAEADNEQLAGGWTVYEDQPAVNLPADAAEAFDKTLGTMTGASYEPLALLGTQVVSGTNYAYLVRQTLVTAEPVVNVAVAFVYAPVEGEPEVMNIVPLNLADYNQTLNEE